MDKEGGGREGAHANDKLSWAIVRIENAKTCNGSFSRCLYIFKRGSPNFIQLYDLKTLQAVSPKFQPKPWRARNERLKIPLAPYPGECARVGAWTEAIRAQYQRLSRTDFSWEPLSMRLSEHREIQKAPALFVRVSAITSVASNVALVSSSRLRLVDELPDTPHGPSIGYRRPSLTRHVHRCY